MSLQYPRLYFFSFSMDTAGSYNTSGLTNGNSFLTIRIPEVYARPIEQDIDVTNFPGRAAQIFRWDTYKQNKLQFQGFLKEESMPSTITTKLAIETYINKRMQEGTSAEYLVAVYDANVYDIWSGKNGSSETVLRGALKGMNPKWDSEGENLGFTVIGEFLVAWSV